MATADAASADTDSPRARRDKKKQQSGELSSKAGQAAAATSQISSSTIRTTRSAARSAAQRIAAQQAVEDDGDQDILIETELPATRQTTANKRKTRSSDITPANTTPQDTTSPKPKRRKVNQPVEEDTDLSAVIASGKSARTRRNKMSTSGPSNGEEEDIATPATSSSRKKSSKGKKSASADNLAPSTPQPIPRKSKKKDKKSDDTAMAEEQSSKSRAPKQKNPRSNREPKGQAQPPHMSLANLDDDVDMDDDDDDELMSRSAPFSHESFMGRGGPSSLSQARALLGGLMPNPGTASKLRGLLTSLKEHNDPTMQALAMEELAEMLLISNEDNLNGQFVPDHFVKELVSIMKGGDFGMSTPEMMELACRCIANLLEALPQATNAVVTGGAISVLCDKLTNMEYMEQAEQAMQTLSKISDEFPGAIVREGGLLACLMHLDFFTIWMQKTAVTTAAKCCYDLSESSFDAVLEVMPTLQNVLNNNEQEVVKQAALCITRIVNCFGYHEKLEQLVTADLLKTVFRLLLPASTTIVGDDVQTRFMTMLSTVARASPKLTGELLQNDVVEIIYQFLTGVSPPEGDDDLGSKIDGVQVMQALIHKPRDQIFGALNVICQILPDTITEDDKSESSAAASQSRNLARYSSKARKIMNDQRLAVLETCKDKVRRFVMILLPTLTHAYDITVNLNVRSTVLEAQLKMLSNIDADILESALRTVPFASFLASILSQQDHNNLVLQALAATGLLLTRLKHIYAYQFCREGVLAELTRLAEQKVSERPKIKPESPGALAHRSAAVSRAQMDGAGDDNDDDDEDEENRMLRAELHRVDALDMEGDQEFVEDYSADGTSSEEDVDPAYIHGTENIKDQIILNARKILAIFNDGQGKEIKQQAEEILSQGRVLASELQEFYNSGSYEADSQQSGKLFTELAQYFSTDALRSITSAELLNSDIIEALLEVLDLKNDASAAHARKAFVEAFMKSANSSPTAFNILIHKLQDLLSRKEHLEVVTVHNNSQENTRMDKDNLSYQLGKQIRLKLEAGEGSDINQRYRNVIISIHAIATFKTLNDYLRPRMLMSTEGLSRSDMLNTLAALTGSDGLDSDRTRERMLAITKRYQEQKAQDQAIRARMASGSPLGQDSSGTSLSSLREQAIFNSNANSVLKDASQSTTQTQVPAPKQATRKSTRRHGAETPPAPAPAFTTPQPKDAQDLLECADERNLEDEDEIDDEDEFDALIEDLDNELDDEPAADPEPVNLAVASTGKVTARKDDGTRVATPLQGTPSGAKSNATPGRFPVATTASPRGSANTRSYVAALQSTPQDWHLEFSIDGKPIALDTTVYRAVHFNRVNTADQGSRAVWNATHTIKYKKVTGPPPEVNTLASLSKDKSKDDLPDSLHDNPATSKILRLLGYLHDLNTNLDNLIDSNVLRSSLHIEPEAQFVNTKLTAKLNRQLEEPLVVASRCLPQWSEDLVRLYPFLFPFEARYLYLQSNYFGYHRAIDRWTHLQTDNSRRNGRREDRPILSLPKKQKVRVGRDRLFESAVKVLDLYASATASLEVEYFDEVGTGLGPTMEFYSNVSKDFALKKHGMWRQNESHENSEYTFSKLGLFPKPMSDTQLSSESGKKVLGLFKSLGKFVARSMLDSRMIDVSFNPMFFRCGGLEKSVIPPLALVKLVDRDLANSLKHIQSIAQRKNSSSGRGGRQQKTQLMAKLKIEIDNLGLDMTLPGYPEIELVKNGRQIDVTPENIDEYLKNVVAFTVEKGVRQQIQEFHKGFSAVFPHKALKAFTPDELVMIFGSTEEDWSIPTLVDSIKADHGFNIDSTPVKNLMQVMTELDQTDRRLFLQFVTGSPKLPIGGFKKLMPIFTVVLRKDDSGSPADEFLPSVMTCTNYLKLPDYSGLEVMRKRIHQAIKEGQGAFHLS